MNKKSKLLISSIATIAMSASLVVGGTYALFTDKSDVNVAINAGKVDVEAYIDVASVKTYSAVWNTNAYDIVENAGLTFATDVDGTPSVVLAGENNSLTISQMVAGDKVTFNLVVENLSDVKVQYQTVIKAFNDNGLFENLNVTIGEEAFTASAPEVYSAWSPLNPNSDAMVIPVEIAMPLGETNLDEDYWNNLVQDQYAQSKSCEILYSVRAVQGNAHVLNPGATDSPSEIIIDTAEELFAFANEVNVNGNSYAGKTVYLGANLDLGGATWTPIGQTGTAYAKTYFKGTFDGQNYEISNFVIEGATGRGQHYASGFFGFTDLGSQAIKNLKLNDFTVEGEHWVGGIVGYATANVVNCEVKNATIIGKYDNDDRDGDKVGAVVGFANNCVIENCKATNVTVKASRDAGAILGGGYGNLVNCVAKDSEVVISRPADYTKAENVGEIVGRHLGGTATGCVATNVQLGYEVSTTAKLQTALKMQKDSLVIYLQNDVALPVGHSVVLTDALENVVIDGNGYTLTLQSGYMMAVNTGKTNVTLKNMKLNAEGNTSTTWDTWDIRFTGTASDYALENVETNRAIAVENATTVKLINSTIKDTSPADCYGVWVEPGATFIMEGGAIIADRGVKADNQYNTKFDSEMTTIKLTNVTITTTEKSAVLLKVVNAQAELTGVTVTKAGMDLILIDDGLKAGYNCTAIVDGAVYAIPVEQ